MALISMGEAARSFKVSKATLSRAIRDGKMSVKEKLEDGTYRLDPAEVARFMETFRAEKRNTSKNDAQDHETPKETPVATPSETDVELRINNARMEAELAGLKALLEAEQRRAETAEKDRDHWRDQAQAQTLLLTHQAQGATDAPGTRRGGLFGWLGGRKAANG